MAEATREQIAEYREDRVLLDPYLDWADGEGVPIIDDFGVDLLTAGTAMGSTRYPFTAEKRALKLGVDVSVKEGGFQIEYEDQDPAIHALYLDELAKHGIACCMGEYMDESVLLNAGG